jgi:hypothetical protein
MDNPYFLELEVDEWRYILASELKHELHHDHKDDKFYDPWPLCKALAQTLPPTIGHGVRNNKHEHEYAPREAYVDKYW